MTVEFIGIRICFLQEARLHLASFPENSSLTRCNLPQCGQLKTTPPCRNPTEMSGNLVPMFIMTDLKRTGKRFVLEMSAPMLGCGISCRHAHSTQRLPSRRHGLRSKKWKKEGADPLRLTAIFEQSRTRLAHVGPVFVSNLKQLRNRVSRRVTHMSKLIINWIAINMSALLILPSICRSFDESPPAKNPGPLSPREELATFRVLKGFKVELVASEPDVVDPVAIAFDERGRLFVCEMIGYPNGGIAKGEEKRGRIRMLTDEDGDGVFEKSVVFASGLRFPTGVLPWKGGLIVTVAPDIIYLEDTDGDGKADTKRILYTGFGLDNIQQIVNSPTYGLDNWVYCVCGANGGTITSPEKPDMPPVSLRGRGIRFKPDEPGSLEPTSGGGQYGLAADDFQHWFVNTNSQHLRQIVLPDHYLRRNPYVAVPAVTFDIPDHGAACKLHRISPFEGCQRASSGRRAAKIAPMRSAFPRRSWFPAAS